MRILVTGGFGFVGRNLTERLVKEGHEVTVVASGSEPKVPGVKKILYMSLEGIHWPEVYGKDVVFHLMANNDTLCNDEHEMLRANLYGPIKMFCAAADGGCKKFVYASSTAVYGSSPAPYVEDETEIAPLNAYGRSKEMFDNFAKRWADEKGVSITALRYCNIYGPGEERKGKRMSMIGQFIQQMQSGKQPVLFRDGEQKRDWVYVKDVVEANVLAMRVSQMDRKWVVYNIGSGKATSFNKLVGIIDSCIDVNLAREMRGIIKYIDCPFPENYQTHTECNIEKAWRKLGFSPSFDVRSGIEDYVTSLRQLPSNPRHPHSEIQTYRQHQQPVETLLSST
jgi:ADP-L-glycero-D-manno-heptose 6-epimerase